MIILLEFLVLYDTFLFAICKAVNFQGRLDQAHVSNYDIPAILNFEIKTLVTKFI